MAILSPSAEGLAAVRDARFSRSCPCRPQLPAVGLRVGGPPRRARGTRGFGHGTHIFQPGLPALVDYLAEIATAAPALPLYYYHMPSMTGARFLMIDYLRAIAGRIPNLAGIK